MKFFDIYNKITGRAAHIQPDQKPIQFYKNPDGSVDTTPRILLVFPIFTHVLPAAFAAFAEMLLWATRDNPEYKFTVDVKERSLLHLAMDSAAANCIQNPWYHGMIVFDDDCLPPPHIVKVMIEHFKRGNPVVGAVGYMRNYPHTTTVGRYLQEGSVIYETDEGGEQRGFEWVDDLSHTTPDEHGLIDVDFCGMPAMFIARSVLAEMRPPFFAHHDGTGMGSTHDIYFCNKVKDMGLPVKVDVRLECTHIGPSPLINRMTRDAARAAVGGHRG
jgi:hypothetical protein